jgi:hypothetical protein
MNASTATNRANEQGFITAARRLTVAIIALAAVSAGTGLFAPSVYRETAWVIPQNRGQDLVTLLVLAVLVLVPVLAHVRRGSPRATLVWLGLLGYLAYSCTAAAFAYAFNELFPVYVALFALSGASLTWFALGAGIEIDIVLSAAWLTLAVSGMGMSIWFFRHCRGIPA